MTMKVQTNEVVFMRSTREQWQRLERPAPGTPVFDATKFECGLCDCGGVVFFFQDNDNIVRTTAHMDLAALQEIIDIAKRGPAPVGGVQ